MSPWDKTRTKTRNSAHLSRAKTDTESGSRVGIQPPRGCDCRYAVGTYRRVRSRLDNALATVCCTINSDPLIVVGWLIRILRGQRRRFRDYPGCRNLPKVFAGKDLAAPVAGLEVSPGRCLMDLRGGGSQDSVDQ